MIKAPYNFIPLSEQVVFPDWADRISHDVPFSDGISGTIDVSLTAESPIFVRNGHTRSDQENQSGDYASFSHVGDRYFLPGSSVKGAIRNVLEILSFGKMDVNPHARFAQRDLQNKNVYPLIKNQDNIHCGWLKENENGYEIVDCGHPYRISQIDIDRHLGTKIFENEFSERNHRKLREDQKNAEYKYSLISSKGLGRKICDLKFSSVDSSKRKVNIDSAGEISGTIVFTGQPNKWKIPLKYNKGKLYEFVFKDSEDNQRSYPISQDEFEQYKFIYAESADWAYAVNNFLHKKGIPVFFRLDEAKDQIKDWGLAFLYKLRYSHTVANSLPRDHSLSQPDLGECIFGYYQKIQPNENSNLKHIALKGRVQFSHFFSTDAKPCNKSVELILGSPKASYYPIYINQENKGDNGKLYNGKAYNTYEEGTPRGWKRYLLRSKTWKKEAIANVTSTIYPVQAKSIFKGTISIHNLRPMELGALLSALTFHGNEEKCFHQIGMAKPYGYGKVKLHIDNMHLKSVGRDNDDTLLDINGYIAAFEKYMNEALGSIRSWINYPQVIELMTVAAYDVPNENNFEYMVLDMDKRCNEFVEAKKEHLYLQQYSTLIHKAFPVPSIWKTWQQAQQENELDANKKFHDRELLQMNQQNEKQKAENQAKRLANRLAFLEERYEVDPNKGKYKVDEFKKLRPRVLDYLKKTLKTDRLPEEDYDILEKTLVRLAANPSKDEKRKNLWTSRTSPIWTFIENVTSKEFADIVFQKIIK